MGWQDFKLVFLSYLYDLIKYAKSQNSSKFLKIRWKESIALYNAFKDTKG